MAALQERLAKVPAFAAGSQDETTRRILALELEHAREAVRHRPWEWEVDQIFGPQVTVPNLLSIQPLPDARSFERLLARLCEVPRYLRDHVEDLREGIRQGRVPPRLAVRRVIAQVAAMLEVSTPETPFVTVPLRRLPTELLPWKESAERRLCAVVQGQVKPAYARYLAFLETEMLRVARDTVGIWSIPGGPEEYAFRVRRMTTTDLGPDEIHRIGLEELEKNRTEMLEIARDLGHRGDLRSFLDAMRDDPRFRLKTREEILERYTAICRRMDRELPKAFGRLPKADYEVLPIEPFREKDSPAAFYQAPSDDGTRKGVFYANTCNPETWPTYDFENLCYHEAVPGHHFQIAIAQETRDLPAFRRHGGFTSYVEGWAHYTERLADEMGMYSTPHDRIGMLSAQAWRAARLVVDTGMHHLRWTRDQALEVMESIRSGPRSDVENEVDRYVIWPGQALAYKVGSRTITEIRERTKKRLGKRFDLRAFHDEVLRMGAVPLSILSESMDRWEPSRAA
jgi:prolyl oligopeptidase